MGREPPQFCPYCGTALSPVDPPGIHHCGNCDEPVFYSPDPCARLAVLDDDSLLLVKVDIPDRELWGTPGGMVESDEDPDEAAARELEEETTLAVDPTDLVLFDTRTFAKFGTFQKTYICFAVDASAVSGTPQADHEVAAAQFFTLEEFDASDGQLLTSWPEAYKDLRWWVDSARTALQDGPK